MNLDRRDLMKRAGIVSAGFATATHALPGTAVAQDAELTVWDTLNTPPRSDIAESLVTEFAESHDGVTTEHRGWSTEELVSTLPRSVEGNQGPDVAQVNNGEALMGPMIRGGQLVSLQPYVEQYGWDTLFPEGLSARNKYSADGTVFGEGDLWGISAESEIVGFYYNRSIFAEHELTVPTTFEEFETLLAALREHGVEPIAFGTLDKWQAIHLFGAIQGTYTTREYLDNIIYRRGDASFEDASMLDAATKLVEWNDSGFFIDGYEGIDSGDAVPLFTSGLSALLLQGSWSAGEIGEALGEDAGFFLIPPHEDGETVLHVGGVGIPYAITTNAEDPDLAAELIASFVSESALAKFVEAGVLPAGEISADQIVEGTLSGDLYSSWNAALSDDAIGHYLDWASPDFYDVLTASLQSLLAGQIDPQAFVTALQEAYAASFE